MIFDKKNETIEDLQYKDLKIIQNKDCFCFGMDAVLLADFASIKKGERVLDLCTGAGIIPILLSARDIAIEIVGIELMPYVADMGIRSTRLNGIDDKVKILCGDIKDAHKLIDGVFDVITVNPPYEKSDLILKSENEYRAAAKHEIHCTFSDICKISNRMLKCGGKIFFIHRIGRLAEIITTMKKFKLEPKRLRFIHPKSKVESNLVLIEGAKDGNAGLRVDYPLFVRDSDGKYTQEIDRIYHRNEE
jgi:tRNA1Val (adenine37-N6)-methyltransferase